jgi:hypothetical protein
MATVTITITDAAPGEENEVNVKVDFDPPVKRKQELTSAQEVACGMLESLKSDARLERVTETQS